MLASRFWPFSLQLCPIAFCISSLISQNNLSSSIPWQAKPCPAMSPTGFWSLPWSQSLYQYFLAYPLSRCYPLAEMYLNSLNRMVTGITFYTEIVYCINTKWWSWEWLGAHVHPEGHLPSLVCKEFQSWGHCDVVRWCIPVLHYPLYKKFFS